MQMCFARAQAEKLSVGQLGQKKVLIADNDKNLVKQLISRLEAHSFVSPDKYITLKANTGSEVIEMARHDKPDLIAIDAKLDEMDGYKVCRHLKSDPDFQKIPILILSDEKEEDTEAEVNLVGADGYLIKPFPVTDFIEKIKWFLWERK